ncbi:MAG: hypothetical protein WD377_06850 [Nitriliruptoraceae bacterium]
MRRIVLAVAVLAIALAGCGGGNQPDTVSWRNIDIDVPDGWYVFEETPDRLSISNVDLAALTEAGEVPTGDVVAMFFTFEPATLPEDWRRLLARRDAEIETDDRVMVDGDIPATRIIFAHQSAGLPTREMVIMVPSRQVVVLSQPVPRDGQQDAGELFLEHLPTFLDVVQQADYGRPLLDE